MPPPKHLSAWVEHVKKVRQEKGCSLAEAMKLAAKTYKK